MGHLKRTFVAALLVTASCGGGEPAAPPPPMMQYTISGRTYNRRTDTPLRDVVVAVSDFESLLAVTTSARLADENRVIPVRSLLLVPNQTQCHRGSGFLFNVGLSGRGLYA
jgi:hypothetical protein